MKLLHLLLILPFITISCSKSDETVKKKLLIEEYTYDQTGVVFKIINDVEHAWNYNANVLQTIDSIAVGKFEYPGNSYDRAALFNSTNYTWFTGKGQYAVWKYQYIHQGVKILTVVFPNKFNTNNDPGKVYCVYQTSISCNSVASASPQFQLMFPIVNDTVMMHLTSVNEYFSSYK